MQGFSFMPVSPLYMKAENCAVLAQKVWQWWNSQWQQQKCLAKMLLLLDLAELAISERYHAAASV